MMRALVPLSLQWSLFVFLISPCPGFAVGIHTMVVVAVQGAPKSQKISPRCVSNSKSKPRTPGTLVVFGFSTIASTKGSDAP